MELGVKLLLCELPPLRVPPREPFRCAQKIIHLCLLRITVIGAYLLAYITAVDAVAQGRFHLFRKRELLPLYCLI